MIIFTQLLFALHAASFSLQNIRFPEIIYIILSVCFTAGAGYIINDIYDIEADIVNKPNKRIIAKHMSKKNARIYYFIVLMLAIVFGFLTGYSIGFLVLVVSILLFYYSSDLKGTPLQGNILVSFLSAVVVFTASKGSILVFDGMFSEYSLFAFFITMGREIIKDIEDMEGDKLQAYSTFPIKFGINNSKWIALVFNLFIVLEIVAIFLFYKKQNVYIYCSIFLIILPIFVISYLVIKASNKKDYNKISTAYKIAMFLGLLTVLVSK